MKYVKKIQSALPLGLAALMSVAVSVGSTALAATSQQQQDASDARGDGHRPDRAKVEAAFKKCGLTPPAKGERPPELSEDQKTCLRDAGLPPPGGHHPGGQHHHRPSQAEVEQLKACFSADNVEFPPPPQEGQRPELSDAQRAEFRKCAPRRSAASADS